MFQLFGWVNDTTTGTYVNNRSISMVDYTLTSGSYSSPFTVNKVVTLGFNVGLTSGDTYSFKTYAWGWSESYCLAPLPDTSVTGTAEMDIANAGGATTMTAITF